MLQHIATTFMIVCAAVFVGAFFRASFHQWSRRGSYRGLFVWTIIGGVAMILLVLAGASVEPIRAKPGVWWQGDLVEIDGEQVASGIKIEIESGDGVEGFEGRGSFRYRLETGCRGAGSVDATGDVQAAEILRPCSAADVDRMNRLTRLSHFVGQDTPPSKVALRWSDREAILSSPLGNARFKNSATR
jgi:hypothetical protein